MFRLFSFMKYFSLLVDEKPHRLFHRYQANEYSLKNFSLIEKLSSINKMIGVLPPGKLFIF